MSQVVVHTNVDRAGLDEILRPRVDVVAEVLVSDPPAGGALFDAADGPVAEYRRTVEITTADDRFDVVQTVDFRLSLAYFAWLFIPLFKQAMRRPGRDRPPWWAPPERLDAPAAATLGTLGILAVVFGYLNTLFTQTIPFAGEEFSAGNSAQGVAGSVVRVGGLLALVVVATADRRGRRVVLLGSAAAGCVLALTGALAPSLAWLSASQMLARAFATAMIILITIVAAEEVPAGCRAYAVSLLAMAGGLGAGVCVVALNLADLGSQGWRLLYLIPVLGLPLVASARRRLTESRRFLAVHPRGEVAGHGGRLLLLAASGLLANIFVAPQSQFGNRFLRSEQGFSGGLIGLFSVAVGTPAAIGIVAGGKLADVRGRRLVAAVSLLGGTLCTVAFFQVSGWSLWVLAVFGNTIAAASIPALGVYGPELFPTGLRGKANGVVAVTSLVGSAIGLTSAGMLADRFDRIGPAMAILAAGPVLLAILVLVAYPETAHRELEDLNPEDRLGR